MVAEVPLVLGFAWAPEGACEATVGRISGCPPSVWLMILIALIAYVVVAVIAYRLGLGA